MDYLKHGLSILSDVELAEARFRCFLPLLKILYLTSKLALDLTLHFISPFSFEETVKDEIWQFFCSFSAASNKKKFARIGLRCQKL